MNKNSIGYKTVLLAVVCAIAGACLAAVNQVTAPIIAANSIKAVEATLEKFFPEGKFNDVTDQYKTDEYDLVDGVYEAEGEGYIFTLHNNGYSSGGFKFVIAFNNDGTVAGYEGLEQNETAGKGSLAFEGDYVEEVKGLTSTDPMPLISGATVTTAAVGAAVTQAEAIFNEINGINFDASANKPTPAPVEEAKPLGETDFSSQKAECTDNGDGTFACKAKGFNGTLSATVTVKDGTVTAIADLAGGDKGDGVGDDVFKDGGLKAYEGATLESTIDVETGATFTSKAIQAMLAAALNATNGGEAVTATSEPVAQTNTLGTEDYSKAKVECTDNGDGTYACKASGFSSAEITATVVVKDNAIESIKDLKGADDGDGVGDKWYKDASVFEGATLESSIDAMSGATFTSNAVKGMAAAALIAAGK